jgi:zinc transporter ZupT
LPVLSSVSRTISSLILSKSWNFSPGKCKNSPHSSGLVSPGFEASEVADQTSRSARDKVYSRKGSYLLSSLIPLAFALAEGRLINWRTSGLRVTIPVPRGRKSPFLYEREVGKQPRCRYRVTSSSYSRPTMFSNTDDFPLRTACQSMASSSELPRALTMTDSPRR